MPLQIHYDPQKLRVVTVASGGLFDRVGQPGTLDRRVDSAAGTIDLTVSRPLSPPGISDSGALVTLTFVPKAAGHSQLQLDPVELHDSLNRVTLIPAAEVMVDVSSSPANPRRSAKPATAPAKPTTTPAKPATAQKVPPFPSAAVAAARPPPLAASDAAPDTPSAQSSSAAPDPKQETGALIMQGVPPGSEVWLDNQPFTATAPSGKVAIRNVPPGFHHLRMSLNNYEYYRQVNRPETWTDLQHRARFRQPSGELALSLRCGASGRDPAVCGRRRSDDAPVGHRLAVHGHRAGSAVVFAVVILEFGRVAGNDLHARGGPFAALRVHLCRYLDLGARKQGECRAGRPWSAGASPEHRQLRHVPQSQQRTLPSCPGGKLPPPTVSPRGARTRSPRRFPRFPPGARSSGVEKQSMNTTLYAS